MTDTGTPRIRAIAKIQEAAPAATMPEVITLPTLGDAAHKACQDTMRILTVAVTDRGVAHLTLAGGFGGTVLSEALAPLIAAQPEEVHRAIHLWFGDECFVSTGDPERNDLLVTPLIAAGIRESQAHRLAAPNEVGSLDEATVRMAHELMSVGVAHGGLDVVHVGLGPDVHVRSLFPGHPAALAVEAPAVTMRNSSKPPPERCSLIFDALQYAGRIMVVADGGGKAEAVRLGLDVPDVFKAPAPCCRGKQTTWYLDEQANALTTD